jgi:hypothetical protein
MTDTTNEGQDGSVTSELPVYFISMQIKDFFRKPYTQELIADFHYDFDRAVFLWTKFVKEKRSHKLPVSKIRPSDLFEFAEETSNTCAVAVSCLCFVYDHIIKEGFLIE